MSYDQWKTTEPRDNEPVCECCGAWLSLGPFGRFCAECEQEDEYYQARIDEQEEREVSEK